MSKRAANLLRKLGNIVYQGTEQHEGKATYKGDVVFNGGKTKSVDIQNQQPLFRSSGRIVLEEYFAQLPNLNAALSASATDGLVGGIWNPNFEVLGTNASMHIHTGAQLGAAAGYVAFASGSGKFSDGTSANAAGLALHTGGANDDSTIVLPHLDTRASHWGIASLWGSENEVIWECALTTSEITAVYYWAGLKLTNTPTIATDDDQAFFCFGSDDDNGATDNTNWHAVSSTGGTDTIAATSVAAAARTTVRLRIEIDAARNTNILY